LAALALGCVSLALLSGCAATSGDDAPPASAAVDFGSALSAGDGEAACRLLTPTTRAALEETSGTTCAAAISALGLKRGGAVKTSRAYGRGAQVVLEDDVMFLTLESTGWRVSAAGCTARVDRPYLCDLEGN